MCPPFTQTTAFSLSRQWSMDLLMICWSAPSSCALCLWDRPNWKLECNTRSAAELPRQHSRPDLSPGLWVAIQTVRWHSERYAAGTRQLISLDEMALRPVETRNDRPTSDECPEEDIAAVEFRGSNLHLSWFLDDLKDRVLSCSVVDREFMRFKNVRAFCHCVSSVTVVLWQKVNLTNNYVICQNKIGVILCENNWRLIWLIIQHTALASFYWTTKNKGYGFYWPTL